MRIGLCMSVLNGGGGNDTVFNSLRNYLERNGHYVTIFSNSDNESILPTFGLFRQLQTIYSESMNNMDLLIFLTGIPSRKIKIPISYYHQQFPQIINVNKIPPKYRKGLWRLYYGIFQFVAGFKSAYLDNENIKHFAISEYLQERLKSEMNIYSTVLYPAITYRTEIFEKINRVITVCRISPEKRLDYNLETLSGLQYVIIGSTNNYIFYYHELLKKQLNQLQTIISNVSKHVIYDFLESSKVYFSSSEETLGLSVLESISAECIPIVIDNTGNKETVPFRELRFNTTEQAREKVQKALNGGYDYLLPELKNHLEKFTEKNYDLLIRKGVNRIEQIN